MPRASSLPGADGGADPVSGVGRLELVGDQQLHPLEIGATVLLRPLEIGVLPDALGEPFGRHLGRGGRRRARRAIPAAGETPRAERRSFAPAWRRATRRAAPRSALTSSGFPIPTSRMRAAAPDGYTTAVSSRFPLKSPASNRRPSAPPVLLSSPAREGGRTPRATAMASSGVAYPSGAARTTAVSNGIGAGILCKGIGIRET